MLESDLWNVHVLTSQENRAMVKYVSVVHTVVDRLLSGTCQIIQASILILYTQELKREGHYDDMAKG